MTDTPTAVPPTRSPAPGPPLPSAASGAGATTPDLEVGSSGNRLPLVVVLALAVVALSLVIAFIGVIRHWVALHTGIIHGGPDVFYNFWSGFGSDLGEVTLISAVAVGVYTGVRKVNCHTKGCWRIGHHPLDGTPFILCRHHHPHVPNGGASHEQILEQHRRYRERSR